MKFLVDAQLPPALAHWLREAGHQAEHVQDAGLRDASDSAIWAYALSNAAIIVTKDEDFAARSSRETTAPVIVWLRVGNSTNPVLRSWIEARLPGIEQMLGLRNRLIEVI